MPIYEYSCEHCGHRFERMQKVSAASPDCPTCGGDTSRLVSLSAFHLKGSGWYASDYKPSAPPSATGGEGAAGSTTGSAQAGTTSSGAPSGASDG